MKNYLELVSKYYPNVQCHSFGSPDDYASIVWSDTVISIAELDAKMLQYQQDIMWDLIQVERDHRISNGVKVGDNWFHSDSASRIQQLGLVMFGANMPASIMWKTMDQQFVPMTPELALQIFQTSASADMHIFAIAEQKKTEMMSLADPSTYDALSGWPPTYGEV